VWWHTLVISALWRLRQKDCELEASLGYISRFYLKKPKNNKIQLWVKW
jgi:hypothetical protein